MNAKTAVAIFLVLGLIIGVFYMMGFRLRVSNDNSQTKSRVSDTPLAVVRLLDASSDRGTKSIKLRAFNQFYGALGVTADKFARWEKENGYGSLGRNKQGQLFIPGFPVFSKIAWIYVDPVDLTFQEVEQLVQECARVELITDDVITKEELIRIREFAQEAVARSATVRFDHP